MNPQAGMVFSNIRLLTEADLPYVLEARRESYGAALTGGETVFREWMRIFPGGMLGAVSGETLAGYAVCHPWIFGRTVPLNTAGLTLPDNADCLYIHDVAVRPAFRGAHIGGWLVAAAMEVGIIAGLRRFTLTAVQSSEKFWERFGFRPAGRIVTADAVPATIMTMEKSGG